MLEELPPLLGPIPGVKEAGADGTFVVLLNKVEQPLVSLHEMPLRLCWLCAVVCEQGRHLRTYTIADLRITSTASHLACAIMVAFLPASIDVGGT